MTTLALTMTALDGAMIAWFTLTLLSLVLLSFDLATNSPVSWVQKLGWWLVVLYTGPVGFIAYLHACRRPFPGGHDRFTRPTWKQGINSEVHCLAGDATGILIAAVVASSLGLAAGWELLREYGAGFASGLFVFQALMMLGMFEGRYLLAVRRTIFAETVSMNFVMLGMLPTMVLLAAAWPESREPTNAAFWFRMSLASVAGGVTAFPINHWLVARRLKHGCMTLPGADRADDALDGSHRSPEPPGAHAHEHHHDHAGMSGHGAMSMPASTPTSRGGEHAGGEAASGHGHGMDHGGHDHGEEHAGHGMARLSPGVAAGWVVGTSIMLVAVMMLVASIVTIPFD